MIQDLEIILHYSVTFDHIDLEMNFLCLTAILLIYSHALTTIKYQI